MIILLVGVATVLALILVCRLNAFIALIAAAIVVSLLSPGEMGEKIGRVATAFGEACGKIGIVIALAAVIGKCLMDSGAADRIVRAFLRLLGEKRAPAAMLASGFVLSIPVFFDTVFYLLVPLARSLYRRTGRHYVSYLTAIGAGAVLTHTLVPPTPGPLFMASELGVDLGLMILVGAAIGLPCAVVGLFVGGAIDRRMPIAMRPQAGEEAFEASPTEEENLPPLWLSLLPVALPVLMISSDTILKSLAPSDAQPEEAAQVWDWLAGVTGIIGNPNLALLVSAAIAMVTVVVWKKLSLGQLAAKVESALMSGGVIILITAAGGAFGAMLRSSGVEETVRGLFGASGPTGVAVLLAGFGVASVMKTAQGSGTVAMITTSSMFAAFNISPEMLGCNPVYLAMTIGSGSMVGSWMNDSGFWIFAKMGVLTEVETLESWSILLAVLGVTALAVTLVASRVAPLM